MAQSSSEAVSALIPHIYESSIAEFGFHPNTDMSRSVKCHTLSKDLMLALRTQGITVRRELHKSPSGLWHYVLAHGELEAPAQDEDVITDLNPWLFDGGGQYTGYLHAPRNEVMHTLETAGAPEEYIALRSVATVILPHTEDLLTPHTHPPLPIGR